MAKEKDGREHDVGDVIGDEEVTAVSYHEDKRGRRSNFSYTLRPIADVEADRKAEAEHQREQVKQAKALAEAERKQK